MPSLIIDVQNLTSEAAGNIPITPYIWGLKVGSTGRLPLGTKHRMMHDLKWHDTAERIKKEIDWHKQQAFIIPSTIVTVAGSLPLETLRDAVRSRGDVGIIATGPLSDWTDAYCTSEFGCGASDLLARWVEKALKAGVQGITCPGYLLADLEPMTLSGFMVIATGIRSSGVATGGHVSTITPEEALTLGAYPVIGREVSESAAPLDTLNELLSRCF